MTVEISYKVIADAKIKLAASAKSWAPQGASLCAGMCIDFQGNDISYAHGACHSWIVENTDLLVLNCFKQARNKCSPEAAEQFVRWFIADDNPFSKAILNRDDLDSILNGGFIIAQTKSTGPNSLNSAAVLWLCKALRYMVESGKVVDCWKHLVDAGVAPFFALSIAEWFTEGNSKTGWTWDNRVGHNSVFLATPDIERLTKGNPDFGDGAKINGKDTSAMFGDKSGPYPVVGSIDAYLSDKIGIKPVTTSVSDGWGETITKSNMPHEVLIEGALLTQARFTAPPAPKKKKGTKLVRKITGAYRASKVARRWG